MSTTVHCGAQFEIRQKVGKKGKLRSDVMQAVSEQHSCTGLLSFFAWIMLKLYLATRVHLHTLQGEIKWLFCLELSTDAGIEGIDLCIIDCYILLGLADQDIVLIHQCVIRCNNLIIALSVEAP